MAAIVSTGTGGGKARGKGRTGAAQGVAHFCVANFLLALCPGFVTFGGV